jgi:dihydrofolate reductase
MDSATSSRAWPIAGRHIAQTLIEHDLVDEYRLMIDPLIVGGGKRLFRDGSPPRRLRLVENQVTSTARSWRPYATTSP